MAYLVQFARSASLFHSIAHAHESRRPAKRRPAGDPVETNGVDMLLSALARRS